MVTSLQRMSEAIESIDINVVQRRRGGEIPGLLATPSLSGVNHGFRRAWLNRMIAGLIELIELP